MMLGEMVGIKSRRVIAFQEVQTLPVNLRQRLTRYRLDMIEDAEL
jgi:hypothetical protein